MTDYVVYHNPAKNPSLEEGNGWFGIYTKKPVRGVKRDDRVWVITSTGPKRYVLAEWFKADDSFTNMPLEENTVEGSIGQFLRPFPRIDQEPWFPAFLKNQGNFGRGFSPITDPSFVEGLEQAAGLRAKPKKAQQQAPTNSKQTAAGGQGFGTPEDNRAVEQAAVRYVAEHYGARGWTARSVETEKRGFDLDCRCPTGCEHVEVKGIRGSECSFILTQGEMNAAKRDPQFVLVAVMSALSSPRIERFTGKQLLKAFGFAPIAYRAARKTSRPG